MGLGFGQGGGGSPQGAGLGVGFAQGGGGSNYGGSIQGGSVAGSVVGGFGGEWVAIANLLALGYYGGP